MKVLLSKIQTEQISRHGEKTYPEECCGILVGKMTGSAAKVMHVLPVENEREDSRHNRYTISPGAYLKAEKWAEEQGLQLLGFYHSHPDHPAQPSQYDLQHAWPNLVYLIMQIQQGHPQELNGFMLATSRERFNPITVEILEDI